MMCLLSNTAMADDVNEIKHEITLLFAENIILKFDRI